MAEKKSTEDSEKKDKRNRGDNWSSEEKRELLDLIVPHGTWWKREVKHSLNYPRTKSKFNNVLDMFNDVRLKCTQRLKLTMLWELRLV